MEHLYTTRQSSQPVTMPDTTSIANELDIDSRSENSTLHGASELKTSASKSEIKDQTPKQAQSKPPIVYGELSILGYNGYVPNVERSNRRNRSKFLLCKRSQPNGIKKSRHYIVKQPQATKAIQDKNLHSISYTFSRSQTIIVEYHQDENTDMFQIGRSSEDPIDFVVMDTATANLELVQQQKQQLLQQQQQQHLDSGTSNYLRHNYHFIDSGSRIYHQIMNVNDLASSNNYQRQLAKVVRDDARQTYTGSQVLDTDDLRGRLQHNHRHQPAVFLNYPAPDVPQIRMADPYGRHNDPTTAFQQPNATANNLHHHGHSSQLHNILQQQLVSSTPRTNYINTGHGNNISAGANFNLLADDHSHNPSKSRQTNLISKRSHATQSTISRFACRILVDRNPPYTARIYAAGFDSSKNIFLGEKATKWEQDNMIDGLTTNGVLLMHPKQEQQDAHLWREVSVDGGIYAIRESRSATQKGTRIENESNVLQDGTLIDLCGATLLWRSVEGFKASPTKKSLEEKLDLLNASRPQCPVGLNTLVIPRKPIMPKLSQHHSSRQQHQHHRSKEDHHHYHKDEERNNHQPYVYLKCGHVQGYHDWGLTDKSNQRTCPICLSVGTVAKLSMGLEPSFYIDSGPLTHVFNPCGHMASEETIKYWCSVQIPHGTHFFHSVCPFCATPLASNEPAFTRLIFQDDLD